MLVELTFIFSKGLLLPKMAAPEDQGNLGEQRGRQLLWKITDLSFCEGKCLQVQAPEFFYFKDAMRCFCTIPSIMALVGEQRERMLLCHLINLAEHSTTLQVLCMWLDFEAK